MGKEQCSSYCIFRSSRKATEGFEKKKFAETGRVGVATSSWCRDLD